MLLSPSARCETVHLSAPFIRDNVLVFNLNTTLIDTIRDWPGDNNLF